MAVQRIDTRALIEKSPFGRYQVSVLLLCFMAMIIDGYDMQIIGVAAAGIRETLKLEPATLGVIITAGQVGVILGAVFLAPFADRIGRKALMVASCVIFGVFSFLTAFADSVTGLIALRVLAGIGLGSIGPAALALGAEYAPKRFKASIPSWIWAAVPTGGMIAGLSAVWLLPIWNWPALFIAAGVLPILVALPLGLYLPESLSFIGTHRNDQPRMRGIALRIAPTLPAEAELYSSEAKLPGVPLKHLFTEGRALGTVLLWILFFLDYGILIFFLSWVPTLIKMATGSTTALGTSLAFWNVGSIFCSFGIGWLVDRFGYYRILVPNFLIIALSMWAIGATLDAPLWLLLCAITVNGAIAGSSGAALMALAANSYPLAVRSTGVGAAYAFGGRTGAFVAPLFGGIMLQMHWTPSAMCYIAGAPLLLGSVILLWLRTQAHFRHEPGATVEATPAIAQPSA
ncbi:MAG TPA: MFS transporter [Stellaceae bacterium]|jgi:AAHS family 4-hydroxybenzoate transporter-like MFS transporter